MIVRFVKMTDKVRNPIRAQRDALGTLPMRAVRHCEALTSATAFGWWLFSPLDIELLWDGDTIFWKYGDGDWAPLQSSCQLPGYIREFNSLAPEEFADYAPPFLTALPEAGTLQIWSGLIAITKPGCHLLIRAPANLPPIGGLSFFEGIVATDRWVGPLFGNVRLTRTHTPIRIPSDYPLFLAQPVPVDSYTEDLGKFSITDRLTQDDWDGYGKTIVEPNTRPDRAAGEYGAIVRRSRKCR